MATCSRQPSIGSTHDEIEILKSIYLDEIQELPTENSARLILFTLKPSVEDGQSKQYNSIQLEILIPQDYPTSPADITLKKPRGLTDEEIATLNSQILSFVHQNRGQAVLFDVIQLAQDFLSCSEVPKLPCSICLNGFHRNDEIFVTNVCHHHFHSHCIGRYIQHVLDEKNAERRSLPGLLKDSVTEEVGCPLCRCPIEYNLNILLNAAQPESEMNETSVFDWSDLANPIQRTHKDLYEKQKRQGGLIDVDEDKKRLLITEDTRIVLPPSSSSATVNLVESSSEVTLANPAGQLIDKETVRLDIHAVDRHNLKKKFHPTHHTGGGSREGGVGGGGLTGGGAGAGVGAGVAGGSNYHRRKYNYNYHGNNKRQEFVSNRKQQPAAVAAIDTTNKTTNFKDTDVGDFKTEKS